MNIPLFMYMYVPPRSAKLNLSWVILCDIIMALVCNIRMHMHVQHVHVHCTCMDVHV